VAESAILYDRHGKIITQAEHIFFPFKGTNYLAHSAGKARVFSRKNKTLEEFPIKGQPERCFVGEYLLCKDWQGICYLYSSDGSSIALPEFTRDVLPASAGGLFSFRSNEGWGLIDSSGTVLVPALYDENISFVANSTAVIKKDDLFGMMDSSGILLAPAEYRFIYLAVDKPFAHFSRDGKKWGLLNKAGEIVLPDRYDWIDQPWEPPFLVEKDGQLMYINEKNTCILNCP